MIGWPDKQVLGRCIRPRRACDPVSEVDARGCRDSPLVVEKGGCFESREVVEKTNRVLPDSFGHVSS